MSDFEPIVITYADALRGLSRAWASVCGAADEVELYSESADV